VIQAGTERIPPSTDHIDDKMNQVGASASDHQGNQPQALEGEVTTGAATDLPTNTFYLIPTATNWQATPQPKPNVDGPQ